MKHLVLIAPVSIQQDLADTLRALSAIGSFTFTQVEGHDMLYQDLMLTARDRVVGYIPHIRLDVLLSDEAVETVLEGLGAIGKGQYNYWLNSVERHGKL